MRRKGIEMTYEVEKYFLMRRRKGITLKQVAKYVGCSVSMLSLYENGRCNMDVNKKVKYKEFITNF